jgi:putative transposase
VSLSGGVCQSLLRLWREQPISPPGREDECLLRQTKQLDTDSDGVLGAPRIHDGLRDAGATCSLNRVAHLMHKDSIGGIPPKKRLANKSSGQRPDGVANHLARQFDAQAPNTKWVTDINYIRTAENWLYLCVVIDLHSRFVVGWSMSHCQDRQLVIQAVLMALWQRLTREPAILHADQGTQFTSEKYQRLLNGHNIVCSMSATGSRVDNAVAEGFFGMLKRDRVNRRRYQTRAEARSDIFYYLERFYNPSQRRRIERLK